MNLFKDAGDEIDTKPADEQQAGDDDENMGKEAKPGGAIIISHQLKPPARARADMLGRGKPRGDRISIAPRYLAQSLRPSIKARK
jgi:hypothetical protein